MKIKNTLTRTIARQKFRIHKNSPHILFGLGIAGVVTSTVLACKATLKADSMFAEMKAEIDAVKNEEPVDVGNAVAFGRKDLAYVYCRNVARFTQTYAPALAVGGVSIALLTGSHIQLTRRNTALTIAYAGLHKAYAEYRDRVRAELGEEKELDLYFGATEETVVGENGKKEFQKVVDPNKLSPYARFFDEGSPNWQKNAEINRLFIQCQQNYANNVLQARGYLFLNEVYQMLGIDWSSAGQAVGWFLNDEGDNFVDFGIFEARNANHVNGSERSILLDFNVDGVIIDKI